MVTKIYFKKRRVVVLTTLLANPTCVYLLGFALIIPTMTFLAFLKGKGRKMPPTPQLLALEHYWYIPSVLLGILAVMLASVIVLDTKTKSVTILRRIINMRRCSFSLDSVQSVKISPIDPSRFALRTDHFKNVVSIDFYLDSNEVRSTGVFENENNALIACDLLGLTSKIS